MGRSSLAGMPYKINIVILYNMYDTTEVGTQSPEHAKTSMPRSRIMSRESGPGQGAYK